MQPKSIKREGNSIQILWSDDHASVYDIAYLRRRCPCVVCRSNPNRTPDGGVVLPALPKTLDLASSHPIGRYALQFSFNDGHDTGIYSFEHLRKVCPCPQCRASA